MAYLVNPRDLNRELARELKEKKVITPPAWAPFVKSGRHNERAPQEADWFYHRAASILRKVADRGPIGTAKLCVMYGGRKNRGVAPDKFFEASTNIIRKALQQLEKGKLIKQVDAAGHKGRVLTKEGAAIMKSAIGKCSTEEKQHSFKERPLSKAAPGTAPMPGAPQRGPKPAPKTEVPA